MNATRLQALFGLLERLEDRFLLEVATVPMRVSKDFEDKAIITLAAGEISRRNRVR